MLHKSLPKKILPLLSFFAVGLLGAMVGTYIVSAHGGDTDKIHSCVDDTTGEVRIVGENDTCGMGETSLDWDKEASSSAAIVCVGCHVKDLLFRLNSTDFLNANLDEAVLSGSTINSQDFTGASFVRAVWSGISVNENNFTNADFSHATLDGEFNDSDFTNATLVDADITSSFTNVDFTNADLTGANTTNSAFTNVTWDNTTCPDGTNSDNNSNTCEGHLEP